MHGARRHVGYRASYALYDLAGLILAILALPALPVVALTRHGRGLAERLGRIPDSVRGLRRPVWVHAASVGEVLAAEPLVQELRRRHSDLPLLMSTTSVTGRETARGRLGVDAVMLLPFDLRWIVAPVMRRIRPRCLIVVETEMWPALFRAAANHAVPCVIASGRVSARALRRYAWIRWLTRAMLSHLEAAAMQTDADATRLVVLGARPASVSVVGSLKFARAMPAPAASRAPVGMAGRPVLVAASTQPGEDEIVLDALAPVWAAYPAALLILAPRRPERFAVVEQLLVARGCRYQRRSQLGGAVDSETRVLLLDTVGELLDFLPAARAVFVGGSLVPIGGHNVLEPALFGKPVAFGPFTANVAEAADALLAAGAAVRVTDARTLRVAWTAWLTDPGAAVAAGDRGRAVVAARAAVASRTAALVERWLEAPRA